MGTVKRGDALELIGGHPGSIDLVVTDPPYAFGGSGDEHALSATVAVVLREAAKRLKRGGWMVVFCAASWRSTAYMAEATRGILTPVRTGVWIKPRAKTKTRAAGWAWATVNALAMRKGKSGPLPRCEILDHIEAEPVMNGRRAELPPEVAAWAVAPFVVEGGLFLDPFAGSGVIVEEASRAGMVATGYEKNAT